MAVPADVISQPGIPLGTQCTHQSDVCSQREMSKFTGTLKCDALSRAYF